MLKETQDSIKARLYDMKYTPFLASYSFFFVYFNAKLFLIFFDSSLSVQNKIDMLSYGIVDKLKTKFKIAFFLGLVLYLYILTNFSYVSVYYTYVALPTLAMLGLFGFGSFKSLRSTAQMIFWFTLIIWIITLFFVSYIGVYLSYISVPILLISGLVF